LGRIFATLSAFRDVRANVPEKLGACCGREAVAKNRTQQAAQVIFPISPIPSAI
jgi:hypothetical protein